MELDTRNHVLIGQFKQCGQNISNPVYRAFVEGEGGCDENWGATINSQNDLSQFPYYATCHAQDACATNTDDCVPTATCTSLDERYSRGFFGTYECTCPNGETGDGKQSGTGCSGDVCSTNANTCITTDTDGNSIDTCISTGPSEFDCVCPDTHVGDANAGGSCTLKVNECADGSHTCDTDGGQQCVDLDTGFTCQCIMNYAPGMNEYNNNNNNNNLYSYKKIYNLQIKKKYKRT